MFYMASVKQKTSKFNPDEIRAKEISLARLGSPQLKFRNCEFEVKCVQYFLQHFCI